MCIMRLNRCLLAYKYILDAVFIVELGLLFLYYSIRIRTASDTFTYGHLGLKIKKGRLSSIFLFLNLPKD